MITGAHHIRSGPVLDGQHSFYIKVLRSGHKVLQAGCAGRQLSAYKVTAMVDISAVDGIVLLVEGKPNRREHRDVLPLLGVNGRSGQDRKRHARPPVLVERRHKHAAVIERCRGNIHQDHGGVTNRVGNGESRCQQDYSRNDYKPLFHNNTP